MSNSEEPSLHKGTLRALTVLRCINEISGGNISRLSRATGISRQALYRILGSLCDAGYLQKDARGKGYHLTAMVTALSAGYREDAWMSGVVIPVLSELQEKLVWPIDFATFVGDSMYLRASTRGKSPLVIERRSLGFRLPMLLSASGRAYLAFCPESERNLILRILRRSNDPADSLAAENRLVQRIIRETRNKGYGYRHSDIEPSTGTIAVPVFSGDRARERVVACVALSYFSRTMGSSEASDRYLPALNGAVARIEQSLQVTAPPS